jgi:molybdopterin-guanine dinucleotide biosynthesis protein A
MNCYILVGGGSRRMGKSKAGMFLDRILAATLPVFDEVIAVHRVDGEPLPVRTIFETPHAEAGPVFGLVRALADARETCFVLGVDYPLVTAEILRYLAGRFETSASPALVPVWGGTPQPLCAGYRSSLLALVEQRIASGRYDLHGLVAKAGAEMIAEEELRQLFPGEPLMNVNTPRDLEAAQKFFFS